MNGITLPAALVASMLTVTAGTANAGVLSASDIFSDFNAVVFGSVTATSDVAGRAVVGGNLTGSGSFGAYPAGAAPSSFSSLTVYGSVTSGGDYHISGDGVAVAGSNSANLILNDGGTVFVGGSNAGRISGAANSVAIAGANSGDVTISGGSVYLGGNSGAITANASASVAINGGNSNNLTLNGGGAIQVNGSNSGAINLNGGSVLYTGNQTGHLNLNNGATATKVPALNLTPPVSPLPPFAGTFQAPLTALSAQLDGVAANSTAVAVSGSGKIFFNASPDPTGTAVFDINSSLFAANSSVTMNLNGATSVIINVDDDTCVSGVCSFAMPSSVNFVDPTSFASSVLWNFYNANSLTFSGEFGGSVLAPLASVSNNSPIDGTLVASSYFGQGELHSYPYGGNFPGGSVNPVPAPEPSTLPLFGAGVAALLAAWRRH